MARTMTLRRLCSGCRNRAIQIHCATIADMDRLCGGCIHIKENIAANKVANSPGRSVWDGKQIGGRREY